MNGEIVELCYGTAYSVYQALFDGMTGYCLVRLVKPFLKEGVTVWPAGAVYFIIMKFLQYIPWYINNFTVYSLGILAAFLWYIVWKKESNAENISWGHLFFLKMAVPYDGRVY